MAAPSAAVRAGPPYSGERPLGFESLSVNSFSPALQMQASSTVIATRCTFNTQSFFALPGIDALDSSLYLFETIAQGTSFARASGSGPGGDGVKAAEQDDPVEALLFD